MEQQQRCRHFFKLFGDKTTLIKSAQELVHCSHGQAKEEAIVRREANDWTKKNGTVSASSTTSGQQWLAERQ